MYLLLFVLLCTTGASRLDDWILFAVLKVSEFHLITAAVPDAIQGSIICYASLAYPLNSCNISCVQNFGNTVAICMLYAEYLLSLSNTCVSGVWVGALNTVYAKMVCDVPKQIQNKKRQKTLWHTRESL